MLTPKENTKIAIDINSSFSASNNDDINRKILYDGLTININPIFDAELFEYKPKRNNLSFYLYFFKTFNPNNTNDLVEKNTDYTYGKYKSDIQNVVTGLTSSILGPFQFNKVPYPYKQNTTNQIPNGAISQSPIEENNIVRPTFLDIPIFYPTISIPFENKLNDLTLDPNGYSNKLYLYNSKLVLEYYDDIDPLRQKLVMSTLIPISDRYCEKELNLNNIKQSKPLFNLDNTVDGYSIIFTKNSQYKGLYVKLYFWDALNGKKIQLFPTTQQSQNRWVLNPKTYNYRYEYLYYSFNNDLTYDIFMYNDLSNKFDKTSFDFDLFQIVLDEYWSDKKINIDRPLPPLPIVYNGNLSFDKTNLNINYDDSGNSVVYYGFGTHLNPSAISILSNYFNRQFGNDTTNINQAFQEIYADIFTPKELKCLLGINSLPYYTIEPSVSSNIPSITKLYNNQYQAIPFISNDNNITITNLSNKSYRIKKLSVDILNVTGGGKKTKDNYKLNLSTRVDNTNRVSTCKYGYDRMIDYVNISSLYQDVFDIYTNAGNYAPLIIRYNVDNTIQQLIDLDKQNFYYNLAFQHGELTEIEGNNSNDIRITNGGNLSSSGYYTKLISDWTQADIDYIYKREVLNKFGTDKLSLFKYLYDSLIFGLRLLTNSDYFVNVVKTFDVIGNPNYSTHRCNNGIFLSSNFDITYTINGMTFSKKYVKATNYNHYVAMFNYIDLDNLSISVDTVKRYIKSNRTDTDLRLDFYYNNPIFYNGGKGDTDNLNSGYQLYDIVDNSLFINATTIINKNSIEPNDKFNIRVDGYLGKLFYMYNFDPNIELNIDGLLTLTVETIEQIPIIENYTINIDSRIKL